MVKKLNRDQAATKADIDRLEDSLKKFAAKTDLKRTERVLRTEILRVEERIKKTEDKLLNKMDELNDKMMTNFDKAFKILDNLRDDNSVGTEHTGGLRVQVDNHEKRIAELESAS